MHLESRQHKIIVYQHLCYHFSYFILRIFRKKTVRYEVKMHFHRPVHFSTILRPYVKGNEQTNLIYQTISIMFQIKISFYLCLNDSYGKYTAFSTSIKICTSEPENKC